MAVNFDDRIQYSPPRRGNGPGDVICIARLRPLPLLRSLHPKGFCGIWNFSKVENGEVPLRALQIRFAPQDLSPRIYTGTLTIRFRLLLQRV